MYEDITVESIKADLLGRLTTDLNLSEGSFTNDMVSGVAYEIWKTYQGLNAVIPIAFVDETSGEYIDKRASEYGLIRKAGTKASAVLYFTGTNGTVIPQGKVFLTSEGMQFVTTKAVTIAEGRASIEASASEAGEEYNVGAGEINLQIVSLSGLSSVTNETAASGGSDPESDSALVKRLYDYLKRPATSGNTSHYKQWALAVDGVGAAKVTPLWDGPGTVKVLIVGDDNGPVDSAITAKCAAAIEANRPIGATVTVMSAQGLNINVSSAVNVDATTTLTKVKEAFTDALNKYLREIAFEKYTLVFNRVAYMLLDIPGVIDYASLTLNGQTGNVIIGDNQVPITGTVVIN